MAIKANTELKEIFEMIQDVLSYAKNIDKTLGSVQRIHKGSTGNVPRFPIIVIYPSIVRYDGAVNFNDAAILKQSKAPYQEVNYTFVIEVYAHNIKSRSAYKQAIGLLNIIKNLLHAKNNFSYNTKNTEIIEKVKDITIENQEFGNPRPYRNGFLQRAAINITYTCDEYLWSTDTPTVQFSNKKDTWDEVQIKELEEELVSALKTFKTLTLPESYNRQFLKRITGVSEGTISPVAKFPHLFVQATEEEEDKSMTGMNKLNRAIDIDIFSKKLRTDKTPLDDHIQLVDAVQKTLNKHIYEVDAGLGQRMIEYNISTIEYGQLEENNSSLYASSMRLDCVSMQNRLN